MSENDYFMYRFLAEDKNAINTQMERNNRHQLTTETQSVKSHIHNAVVSGNNFCSNSTICNLNFKCKFNFFFKILVYVGGCFDCGCNGRS